MQGLHCMTRYKNLGGNSGVFAYEIASNSITVQFQDGGTYLYDYRCSGCQNVAHMKTLAVSGIGLNSFISTYIRKNYAAKLR